jgi:hypothetical protein
MVWMGRLFSMSSRWLSPYSVDDRLEGVSASLNEDWLDETSVSLGKDRAASLARGVDGCVAG